MSLIKSLKILSKFFICRKKQKLGNHQKRKKNIDNEANLPSNIKWEYTTCDLKTNKAIHLHNFKLKVILFFLIKIMDKSNIIVKYINTVMWAIAAKA